MEIIMPTRTIRFMYLLRSVLVKEGWFTHGNKMETDKIIKAHMNNKPASEIAAIIWACSENADYGEICEKVRYLIAK